MWLSSVSFGKNQTLKVLIGEFVETFINLTKIKQSLMRGLHLKKSEVKQIATYLSEVDKDTPVLTVVSE
jgi:hypothetical protein